MIRVLLVENSGLMRGALAALLAREEDIDVLAEAGGNGHVLARALSYRPDVVVIDVDSLQGEQFASVGELPARIPECRILLVTGSPTPERLRWALSLHAPGIVGKNASDRLVEGIHKVVGGERYIDPELALLAIDVSDASESPLTRRESEVLRLAADGTPTREIAKQLSLSVGTVRNHLSSITNKAGARNRIDAIRIARESGWL